MAAKKFRAQSLTTPKKAAKKAAKKTAAKKPSNKAEALTVPKKRTAKKTAAKRVAPTRTLPKPVKRNTKKQNEQSITAPAYQAKQAAKKAAHKEHKASRTAHFIEAAAVTGSVPQAVMAAEGSVSYPEARDMMKDPQVIAAIATKRQSLAAEAGITSLGIMLQYRAMGMSNMNRFGRLLLADNVVNELKDMDPMDTAAIQELTTETYWDESAEKEVKRVKLKLYPKEVALNKMAQHLGIKGFGGPLNNAGSKVGVETVVSPDGTVTTRAILSTMGDEELERIAAGEDDGELEDERTE